MRRTSRRRNPPTRSCSRFQPVLDPDAVEPETWAVVGGRAAADGGWLNVPPVLASTFQLGSGRAYAREHATPTWEAFEQLLGGLEGGEVVAFASGMAAVAAAGAAQGRWRLLRLAVEDTDAWVQAAGRADLLWLESPSNPLLAVADLPAVCAAERGSRTLIAVDSTFATPLVQRPLEL